MRYRALGRSGIKISEVGFGCGGTAGLMTGNDYALQARSIRHAVALGINYFDTAAAYGAGQSEDNIGRVLSELDGTVVIATKVTLEWEDLDDIPGSVRRSVEGSLQRLRRERLDVVHIHNRVGIARAVKSDLGSGALLSVNDVLGEGGVFETLNELKTAGQVGAIGFCAFGGEQSSVDHLIDSHCFDSVLVNYSLLNASAWLPSSLQGTRYDYGTTAARAAQTGLGIVALRILEGGILSGRFPAGPMADVPAAYHGILRRLLELDMPTDCLDLTELTIRYVLSNPRVSTALVGFSSIEQIDAAVDYAARGPIPDPLLGQLDGIHR